MPRRTDSMSAPRCSANSAIWLMKLILVASMQLAAYLVSSALRRSMKMMRSWLRLKGAYRSRITSRTSSRSQPMMIRSGRRQSATAEPSLRNSGLETISNCSSRPAARRLLRMWSRNVSPVPTGTVDFSTRITGATRWRATASPTDSTYFRSAEPSSSDGVPTAINNTSPCSTASFSSWVKRRRPLSRLSLTMAARPGSKMVTCPFCSDSTLCLSTSMQMTS
ncbi:hypothetical protein PFLmoz3_04141 [Pseudomonas fluorescens]|uniref:Uncharacterized protein n=1 Tax=Pseudomonas fluorescens TaxID=294 RepID=A0A120G6U0_PSEFL|nr:hypothetical protein PFLmoz3_04141 [Pseudomonas fluorescens]